MEKALRIQQFHPSVAVRVVTTAPICSKTKKYLKDSGIEIEKEEFTFPDIYHEFR